MTLAVVVLSYAGQLNFTAAADRDAAPASMRSQVACAAHWTS
jgi:hypothetical protein